MILPDDGNICDVFYSSFSLLPSKWLHISLRLLTDYKAVQTELVCILTESHR